MESKCSGARLSGPWPQIFRSLILWPWAIFYPLNTSLSLCVKSRDITLPTKVRRVKAVVFPVVMCGCERWIIKEAEHQELMLLNCGVGEDS